MCACERMVLEFLGFEMTEAFIVEVRTILEWEPDGAAPMNIQKLDGEWGLDVSMGFMEVERLREFLDQFIPVIVVVETTSLPYRDNTALHTLVAVGYDDDNLYVNDGLEPASPIAIPWENFHEAWELFGNFGAVIRCIKP